MGGRALNPDSTAGDIEARWANEYAQVVVIDN
jgi:hypothetical protein